MFSLPNVIYTYTIPKATLNGIPFQFSVSMNPAGPGGSTTYSNSFDMSGYKIDLTGKVLGKFGKAGKQLKEFGSVNQIDCRSENELFVGEVGNWRVQKLTLHAN